MEFGWVMLIVLAVMGGFIAYLGDKIGSRVGKRKIKLFGLRPKYSSILITILTGISIAAVTLGVMSVLSQNVRIALFGMHQLQMQKAELEAQRDKLLQQARDLGSELDEKNALIVSTNGELVSTQNDLQQAKAAHDDVSRQLSIAQVAYDQAISEKQNQLDSKQSELNGKQEQVDKLEATEKQMRQTINELETTQNQLVDRIHMLNTTMTNIREGTVLFRVGEVLSSSVIHGGMSAEQTKEQLSFMMKQTNTAICRNLGITDDKVILVYISPDEFNNTVQLLQQAGDMPKLVRVIAAGNIMLGEPALVHLETYNNKLVYHKGDIVYEERLNNTAGNAELRLMQFLHGVNQTARTQGLLPDPLTGNVGALTAMEMFDTISKIRAYNGSDIIVKAIADSNIYTSGPLRIDIRVGPAGN
ncbi:MAG: DUF3084 domain-containing protein [Megasphaera sp.]|jgi:uncharacterized protein (DUF3084 family)|nr:DUF3084 domain-containing protein [Megasphaera sp.]MCH4187044.1 DUF3084 domain-containing protein [Megasphaera sp.]MCH4217020.1 DUF3084 domain-containing protein [Megasphaera sp.]